MIEDEDFYDEKSYQEWDSSLNLNDEYEDEDRLADYIYSDFDEERMIEELFEKTVGALLPSAEYEEVKDTPGENIQMRVTLPFYNLETEETIIISLIFDTEHKLFQISDLGFCCSKLNKVNRKTLNKNRNFIRSSGLVFDFSKENNFFFMLSPALGYEDDKIDMKALIGHYLTVLLSYNI